MPGIFVGESILWVGECGILRSGYYTGYIHAVSCDSLRYVTCQGNGK